MNGRTRRDDLEPFSGVLRSLIRDLFKSQPSGERKTVVLHLEKQVEKVVSSSIGANGPSARRVDIGARLSGKDIEKGVVGAKTK